MLKKSILIMTMAISAGCSSVSTYDKIAENVNYTYDHQLRQSVIKGPVDTIETHGAEVRDFKYDLIVKDIETYTNVSFSYKDTSPRNYTHVVDSTGERYNFARHNKKIVDCGVSGSFDQGKCLFSESFSFKMPRQNRYHFAVIGNTGKNISFEINKNYLLVINDFVYKLKTPRADYNEEKIKKEALLTAKPMPVEKPDVKVPAPIVGNSLEKDIKNAPVVSSVVVNKPLIVSSKPATIKKFENTSQCNCSNDKEKVVKVYKPVNKPVLTPMDTKAFCSGVVFKNSCAQVSSCREAYDQLACGNKKLDPTNKGMPCPNVCKL